MKQKMTIHETISITSMLFGMFFGAGNLIFPVYMGQLAGQKLIPAIIGFCVTGVGLPLLGIVPEDKQVMLAAGQGLPLVLYAHKDAARAYLNIAKRLMGAKVPLLRIH